MNDDIASRVLAIEARGRYEVSSFARKRASPTEQPRELIDRIPMSGAKLGIPAARRGVKIIDSAGPHSRRASVPASPADRTRRAACPSAGD